MPRFDRSRALELLRIGTELPDAQFRPHQEDAIRHVVERRSRLLLVQKTGWGKSFVYFIATKLLREIGRGPALLFSPLLSLMRNQIAAAERMGVRAERVTSDNVEQWDAVEEKIRRDEVDILLVAPERLANQRFVNRVESRIKDRVALLVVDEAHCISDWGHDFRPDYRRIRTIAGKLPQETAVLATTATANDRVMNDLAKTLGPALKVKRGPLARPSLALQTIRMPAATDRLAWLAETVPKLRGSGIIYTLTVPHSELVADWLTRRGLDVGAYHRRSPDRERLEEALLRNKVKGLAATTALGMGFDKPDLGFVIHYQTPCSVVDYYQQVGRAGRGEGAAYGILLNGREDEDICDHFIKGAFPTRKEVSQVLGALESAEAGLSLPQLAARVNMRRGRIENALKLLSLEPQAPVAKEGSRWYRTPSEWESRPRFWERVKRLTDLRQDEKRQMQEYVALGSGHMEFLVRALDGPDQTIAPPPFTPLSADASRKSRIEAARFLRRLDLPIRPRRRWPAYGLPKYDVRGKIPDELQAQEGRALGMWEDGVWGDLVRKGKYEDKRFDEELVGACKRLLERWNPDPPPRWVTCIPSRRNPDLVPALARRVADVLGLPFREAIVAEGQRAEQKRMENAIQKARNLDGAFSMPPGATRDRLFSEPVLLVDDIVGSGWTLTVAVWLLRRAGCGDVHPLALCTLSRG